MQSKLILEYRHMVIKMNYVRRKLRMRANMVDWLFDRVPRDWGCSFPLNASASIEENLLA